MGEGGQTYTKGHVTELSTASAGTLQLLGHARCLGEAEQNHSASQQSGWDRKDSNFTCQLLPISCHSHP